MRRLFLLTAVALIGAVTSDPAIAGNAVSDAGAVLSQALQAYRSGDCAKTTSLVAPVIARPQSATGKQLSLAYDLAIECARQAKDLAKAGDYAKRAIALDDGSDFAWTMAVAADFEARHYAAGLDTIDRMLANGRGGALDSISPFYLLQVRAQLGRAGDDADETRLLAILSNPAYDPNDAAVKIDSTRDRMRALYARKLLAAGKEEDARGQIADLVGYSAMTEIAFDSRLRALYGKPVDFREVVEADLARHRAMLDRYPHALAVTNAIALDLHRLGRDDEEIVLLKATLARLTASGEFDDLEDHLPWFWNAFAYAYVATGKYDEMVDAFTKGSELKEGGAANVSQVINLASQQVVFGRPKDALLTLGRMGESPAASPYGLMQIRFVRGCAYAALGELDKARTDLAYAIAHEKDDPATVTALDICVGDEEGAAASYIRRLAAVDDRRTAMLDLADYDAPDPRAPKSIFAPHFDRVRKRADVVAAIRAAGGPVRIHLQTEPF
jgi:tetratricopeptide (TPR) repeat protein